MRYSFKLSTLVGKVPNYVGTLLDIPNNDNDIENVKAYCDENSIRVEYRAQELYGYTFSEEEAASVVALKLGLPETRSVVVLNSTVAKVHRMILESGFTEADYSIITEDSVKFLVAKTDVLVMLKLIK